LDIVHFRIEKVNRFSRWTQDRLVDQYFNPGFAQFLGGLIEILGAHFQGNMRSSIIEVSAFDGFWSLKEHQTHAVFHKKPGNGRKTSMDLLVRAAAVGIEADFRAFHAEDFTVELGRPVEIIARQPNMINLLNLHGYLLALFVYFNGDC